MTHPQYRKVLLQRHVALESHGLAARARLARTENYVLARYAQTTNCPCIAALSPFLLVPSYRIVLLFSVCLKSICAAFTMLSF